MTTPSHTGLYKARYIINYNYLPATVGIED